MKLVSGGADSTVGISGPSAALEAPLKASAGAIGLNIATRQVDEAAGRTQVANGDLDALLVGDGQQIKVVVKKNLDDKLSTPSTCWPASSRSARRSAGSAATRSGSAQRWPVRRSTSSHFSRRIPTSRNNSRSASSPGS